ncbi:MAG: response regulator [Spirochaetota bacterium]|nr:response regulator [Spirochaetota bacterium]
MSKNVLTVDDSPSMRQIIKSCLTREGYIVSEAENGEAALEKVKHATHFDLLIVDVNMPVMDGISFVREARKLTGLRNVPIVMLTTESGLEKKAEGQAAGATGWITKPFEPQQFVRLIQRLTGERLANIA